MAVDFSGPIVAKEKSAVSGFRMAALLVKCPS